MQFFIVGLHITLCFFLILVVLLQPGKGADFGAAMGGSSQDVFGATGSVTLLTKLTAIVAGLFMATSLTMAWFSSAGQDSSGVGVDDIMEELESDATPEPGGDTGSEIVTPTEPATEPADVAGDDDSSAEPSNTVEPDGDSAPGDEPAPEPEASSSEEPTEPEAAPASEEPADPEAAPATEEIVEPAPADPPTGEPE